ncbi:DUF1510 family protein [Anaerobacillus sp. HL2]|nr:DUF1510 family protein [Anaerobacillus sp. HL2]
MKKNLLNEKIKNLPDQTNNSGSKAGKAIPIYLLRIHQIQDKLQKLGQWKPIGTVQAEPFTAVYNKDHINWEEMKSLSICNRFRRRHHYLACR